MYSLGIDIGSSSIKVSLLDIEKGVCLASSTNPTAEMKISSPIKGWAEQDPMLWWKYICDGVQDIGLQYDLKEVACIGITYQMHGLVAVDKDIHPVRDAIIWCDSRAVAIGEEALQAIGQDKCVTHLLNSPGNFTASKLAWVKRNEPELYDKIYRFMLPGDYINYLLTGDVTTTETGLSEQILWDFKKNERADFVAQYYGIDTAMIPDVAPSIGISGRTTAKIEGLLGIPQGTPVSYRAGDQPNNAFSLDVLNPGEVAATGGTSGVVYAVSDKRLADPQFRVNSFLHVNHSADQNRYGVLLCINGTGILNSWVRRNIAPDMTYSQMNIIADSIPVGSDGLLMLPFGNGAERVLCNRQVGAGIAGIDLVRHSSAHIIRAAQEGIAFSFRYGLDVIKELGMSTKVIHAGKANLFLSPIFRRTLATLCDTTIEILSTDGALGAARGAALGCGYYKDSKEAFASLQKEGEVTPVEEWKQPLEDAYGNWKEYLNKTLQ